MSSIDSIPTRRQRLRARTIEEIEQSAFELIDGEGAHALSLAAIAKAMGMSAPALYRYFASREALLDTLVVAAYRQLVAALERSAQAHAGEEPAARLRAVIGAYRSWALAYPHRYTLIFTERPSALPDSSEAIAAISPGMELLLHPLLALAGPTASAGASASVDGPDGADGADGALERQLLAWSAARDQSDAPHELLRLALLTWTRAHGIVSLEIVGAFADMGIDAGPLLDGEVDAVLAAAESISAG
jgi:AcrR family transcriptional regulator